MKFWIAVVLTLAVIGVAYAVRGQLADYWDALYTKLRAKVNSVFDRFM